MPRIKQRSRQAPWKVFSPSGEYVASCHYAEDAAAVVAGYGSGAKIRWGHLARDTVWTDGKDGSAADSYDDCAVVCNFNLEEIRRERGWT